MRVPIYIEYIDSSEVDFTTPRVYNVTLPDRLAPDAFLKSQSKDKTL